VDDISAVDVVQGLNNLSGKSPHFIIVHLSNRAFVDQFSQCSRAVLHLNV
jgi:hypothetical protein